MRVWSFIQKCHNRVIYKVSTVGQPARARDVGTKMVEGENTERSRKKTSNRERGRWIGVQTSAKGEEVQCRSCPDLGSVIYS